MYCFLTFHCFQSLYLRIMITKCLYSFVTRASSTKITPFVASYLRPREKLRTIRLVIVILSHSGLDFAWNHKRFSNEFRQFSERVLFSFRYSYRSFAKNISDRCRYDHCNRNMRVKHRVNVKTSRTRMIDGIAITFHQSCTGLVGHLKNVID